MFSKRPRFFFTSIFRSHILHTKNYTLFKSQKKTNTHNTNERVPKPKTVLIDPPHNPENSLQHIRRTFHPESFSEAPVDRFKGANPLEDH